MLLTYFKHLIGTKKKRNDFLKYHFGAVILFGILYWIQDMFVTYQPKLANELGFGKAYNPPDSLFDWVWFSAITQTTVGYDRLSDGGKRQSFNNTPNYIFKIINFVQICSIFILSSLVF